MLSRIADTLYWMSRYLERANNTSRLIGINLNFLVEVEDAMSEVIQWKPLLSISGTERLFGELYPGRPITAEEVIDFLTREPAHANSILNCFRLSRENARTVRDRISKEMWESMNDFWLQIDSQLKRRLPLETWPEFHKFVRNGAALFNGLAASTMMRGEAFAFYQLGTFVERADMTARILDVRYHLLLPDLAMVGSPLDYYQWGALLKSLSGFEAYRRKVHAGFRPIDVAEFVLFEREFPRSLRFTIERIYDILRGLGGTVFEHESFGVVSRLLDEWEHAAIQEIFFKKGLHEFLRDFLAEVSKMHAALAKDFFTTYLG